MKKIVNKFAFWTKKYKIGLLLYESSAHSESSLLLINWMVNIYTKGTVTIASAKLLIQPLNIITQQFLLSCQVLKYIPIPFIDNKYKAKLCWTYLPIPLEMISKRSTIICQVFWCYLNDLTEKKLSNNKSMQANIF